MTKKGFGLASDLFDTLSMHGFDNIACFWGAFLTKSALRNFERGSKRILNEMNKNTSRDTFRYSYTSRRKKPCYIRIQDSDYGASLF